MDAAIQASSPVVRKQALQRLCSLLRQGGVLAAPLSMKALVLHALVDTDSKVRRWAFNALAQFGEPKDVPLMRGPWLTNRDDPEVFEAGLTALAHLLPKDELLKLLASNEIDTSASVVMALGQQSDGYATELAALRLDVERSSVAELRAATLLIGLRKAPDTLFSGRFPVADVIGDLNTHPDAIVAQYSFWATVEHPLLGLANARVAPADFRTLPPNVQGWAFRLLTKANSSAVEHYDAIVEASQSAYYEVREGVAIAIRDVFYDSLDTMVRDWLLEETDPVIRDRLLEHMAAHSGRSSFYRDEVIAAFRAEAPGSIVRSRLEAANRDDGVSLAMRKMALQTSDPGLFADVAGQVTNNTQNFSGSIAVGGISNAGIGNTGPVQIMTAGEAQARAAPVLEELRTGLAGLSAPAVAEVLKAVDDAAKAPTKSRMTRVVEMLKSLKDGGQAVAGVAGLVGKGYDQLSPLLEHFPHYL